MNPVVGIFLCFSVAGIFFAIRLLALRRGDRKANLLLATFTFLFGLELLNNCLRWSGWIAHPWMVHFHLTHFPFWLVYGPLVYMYVRRITTLRWLRPADILFSLPPLLMVVLLWDFYTLSGPMKMEVMEKGLVGDYIQFPGYGIWIVIPLMFFYAALTYFRFGPSRSAAWRQNRWVGWFVGSYLGFVTAFSTYIFLVRNGWMDPSMDYLVDLAIVCFIGLLAYFGFYHPQRLEARKPREKIYVKYRKTGLGPALSRDLAEKLRRIMQEQKPYLNPDLRLNDLCGELGLSRNNTSQLINEQFNRSFFDFVNEYRVQEAKKRLQRTTSKSVTITGIAFDVGFNTRASFYKAFRKFSDRPPGDFLNRDTTRAS
jgi:AraC-like DNA-binding protein